MSFSAQVISNRSLQVASRVGEAAQRALEESAEDILRESAAEVPHDTGDLMRSGTVEPHGDEVWIRYPLEYAAKQHEEPGYAHTGGRKWKYLEDPLRRNAKQVIREIADSVSVVLRG
jgi:hypothetical protein